MVVGAFLASLITTLRLAFRALLAAILLFLLLAAILLFLLLATVFLFLLLAALFLIFLRIIVLCVHIGGEAHHGHHHHGTQNHFLHFSSLFVKQY